ncbi:retrovirus-related pol polyprotein from transposon TNT 1-94 [Tanacetum coccineum]|uniref:Retrovirus-related pol polyprotein from transposon TNT 1-94 n=1 Tax=Tanacetum coccineum TaxID=301880 RepID=A0ABQ4XJZ4_9ASTR
MKTTPSSKRRLQILHIDLCGPMPIESINSEKYVLVIVDDYSRYTWTHFLRSKDETPEVLIDFLKMIQRGLHAQAEAIATACFTQNRSFIIHRHEKTPYYIINGRKPTVKFFHIFGSLCYIVRDGENLDKLKEIEQFKSRSPKLRKYPRADKTVKMSLQELEMLFGLMFDEYFSRATKAVSKSSAVTTADASDKRQQPNITPSTSTTVAADTTHLYIQTTHEPTTHAPTVTTIGNIIQAENAQVDEVESINIFGTSVHKIGESYSHHVDSSNVHTFYQ